MFEALISPRYAEKNPFMLFFVGMLYSSLSLFLTGIITRTDAVLVKHASLLLVSFTTIFSIPFIHSLIRRAAIGEVIEGAGLKLFSRHSRALLSLISLFLGFLIAFSFWYSVLPQGYVVIGFRSQIEKFCSINAVSMQECVKEYGLSTDLLKETLTGRVTGAGSVNGIFFNNFYVLIFTLIFSLAFGAGAIFILAWNASVIATAIGMLVRVDFTAFYTSFMMYMLHGIPEIAAYMVIALAGGIMSTSFIRQDFRYARKRLVVDIISLVLVSLALLLIAALTEIYITPLIFG